SSGGGSADLSTATEFESQQADNAFNIAFNALSFSASSETGVTHTGSSTGTDPITVDYEITFVNYNDFMSGEVVNGSMQFSGTYTESGSHDFNESGTLTFGGD